MSPTIEQHISLQPFNSLALPAYAEYFCSVSDEQELFSALEYAKQHQLKITPLGGGSNLILAGDLSGLVIHINTHGISHHSQGNSVEVTFAAGENWHQAVLTTLEQGWFGMENLSLIPGNMGAAPIQNIGAYGVELADLFVSLRAVEIATGKLVKFNKAACEFAYRDSLFKNVARDQFIILDVTLCLSIVAEVNISYPALKSALESHSGTLTPEKVSQLVCQIRRQKLPDPAITPNAGSFFKNPLISNSALTGLLEVFPQMPNFPQPDNFTKIPAAWLIDQCGYKGLTRGSVGVHKHQALVLVNHLDGGGTGEQLLELAEEIREGVWQRFAIRLELEPRVYGSIKEF